MAETNKHRLIQDVQRSRRTSGLVRPRYVQPMPRANYTQAVPKRIIPRIDTTPETIAVHYTDTTQSVPPPTHDIEEGLLAEVSAQMTPAPKQRATRHKKQRKQKTVVNPSKHQTIERHIDELRRRALWCVMALVIGGAIGYRYQSEIIEWLVKPLGQQLFYTSPTGGFDFLIKICLFFGFLLAIPIIIYNVIRFIAPAVPQHITYSTTKILIVSIVLALCGVSFAYFISLPAALHFLNNFTNEQVQSLISAQEYFNFVMIYVAGFAALFQMPLLFAFVNKVTPMRPGALMKKQRVIILISFIIAAVLTPTPDPMNQTLMAIPIIGLYQTSIGVVWQDNKRTTKKKVKQLRRQPQTSAAI